VRVGIGLPTAVSPADGRIVVEWAAGAEDLGFGSVAAIDRLLAPTYDPLTVLAAAAVVTTRVELYTSVLLTPLRPTAVVASQAATVDQLSGGRLRLGVGVGSRRTDYEAAGVPFERRGKTLDQQLPELRRMWQAPRDFTTPGPAPHRPGGPPILLGGTSEAAVRRVVQHGSGWICGVGGAAAFTRNAEVVRERWHGAGRDGTPWLMSVISFALGANAADLARRYLRFYYGAAPFLESMIAQTPTTLEGVRATLDAHRQAGCDEVLLLPCAPDRRQLKLAAETLSADGSPRQ
jgi:alkanesulfonate monooxygenase SsuD/methylene tetrahydromethanopterin reductase-like flavin-dependent oxidoreductase (luciferase family)